MASIYISYNNRDKDIASQLSDQLTSLGHTVRYDSNLLNAGDNFVEALNQGMREAEGFVFIFTQNTVSSAYVMKEYGAAEMMSTQGKFLIPLVSDESVVPDFVRGRFYIKLDDPELISKIQKAIPLSDPKIPQVKVRKPRSKVTAAPSSTGHWFLKLNPGTWNLTDLQTNRTDRTETLFGTHNLQNERRVDYELFFQVKKGDKLIGFAFGNSQSAVCVFEVTQPVNIRKEVGEVIAMTVERVIDPSIPVDYFRDLITFGNKLDGDDPERLFPISEAIFNEILDSDQFGYTSRESYLQSYTTEGDHRMTEDQLSFTDDIVSLGAVICLKKVKPPLAIGLFGKWGAGKSFFMEKLSEKIGKLAGTDDRYVRNVVPVRFNSWHYSDANLWASLITELFDSLKTYAADRGQVEEIEKLSASLQLTNQHREEAEQKRQQLNAKVTELREKQKERRGRLEDLSGLKFLRLIITDPKIKKDLESLNNDGLTAIKANKAQVDTYVEELNSTGSKVKGFWLQLRALRGIRWLWLVLSAIFIFFVVWLIKGHFKPQWDELTLWFSVRTGFFALLGGKAVEAIRSYREKFEEVKGRWESLKKTFEERTPEQNDELGSQEKELLAVTQDLRQIEQKLDQTKREISDIGSGKKLLEFIDQRSRDEGYARQLGLIASIRKDFQTLDKLLRAQHTSAEQKEKTDNPENVQLQIDRIVLYIDDLDRCSEEIVVRVLEAIHLLLAFPLFVVMVGVDPRWLNNALTQKYRGLFHSGEGDSASEGITSYDYLEKIFQVPFTLREADSKDRQRLLKYLMRNELAKEASSKTTPAADQSPDIPANPVEPIAQQPAVNIETSVPILTKVDFREEEIAYMESISGMFGATPRMMNRYVNIYRILKSHKSYQVASVPSARDYRSAMFVLGVIVGCPVHARDFVERLNATKEASMVKFIEKLPKGTLRQFITKHTDKSAVEGLNTVMIKKNLALISRFSFRTYDYAVKEK